MIIAERIKKIRELRKLKQVTMAMGMKISQQAYSCLEKSAGNARLDTLRRLCDVLQIEVSFLLAIDVPITDETIVNFGARNYNELIDGYKKMQQKLEIYEELLSRNIESHQNQRNFSKKLTASVQRA